MFIWTCIEAITATADRFAPMAAYLYNAFSLLFDVAQFSKLWALDDNIVSVPSMFLYHMFVLHKNAF